MANTLKEAQAEFAIKRREFDALTEKSEPTKDEVGRAKLLNGELKTLQTEIGDYGAMDGLKADSAAFKAFDTNPAAHLPHANGSTGTKSAVGVTEIDLMSGEIVSETGAGLISAPQIKAIANPDYRDAFESWVRAGGSQVNMSSKKSIENLSEGIDVDGGFLVPPEMIAGIIKREPTPTRICDQVATINVSTDQAMMLKSLYESDDLYSSNVRVYKTGESQAAKKSDKPQFGLLKIDIHGWTGELTISKRLLEDTSFDIMGHITNEFRTAQRNHCASKILTGNGNGEHFGILTRAGKKDGPDIITVGTAADGLTYAGLQDLKFSVPEQYEQSLKWLFNKRSTGRALAGMVDKNDRPLWPEQQQAGMVNGEPANFLGYGYLYEAFMPAIAAGAFPMIFGDPRGYIRAMRIGMRIQVLREIEARNNQVVFLVDFREGGEVAEPWRLKVGKTN